jgi:DNA-binding response OmpR family regulator
LVDDDSYLLILLSLALPDMDLVEATRFEHAATLAREGGVDALIVDRRLPDGDGLELVRLIRDDGSGVPVLVFTAGHDEAHRLEVIAAGADEYLAKREEIGDLAGVRTRIDRLLEMTAEQRRERRTQLKERLAAGEQGDLDPPPKPELEEASSRTRRFRRR